MQLPGGDSTDWGLLILWVLKRVVCKGGLIAKGLLRKSFGPTGAGIFGLPGESYCSTWGDSNDAGTYSKNSDELPNSYTFNTGGMPLDLMHCNQLPFRNSKPKERHMCVVFCPKKFRGRSPPRPRLPLLS